MYAVIFKAKTKELDESYFTMAKRMRAFDMIISYFSEPSTDEGFVVEKYEGKK